MSLLVNLNNYIKARDEERKKFSLARSAASLFATLGFGIPYSDKRKAWLTIKQIQANPNDMTIKITENHMKALNDGRLKEVIVRNSKDLPDWFNKKFNDYRDRAARMERKKFETQQRWMEYLTIR